MSENKTNKKDNAAVGIAGAIIGAGIAVAANKVLSDKKTRAQLKKTAVHVKGKVSKAIEDVKKRTVKSKDTVNKKIEEEKKEVLK